MAWQGSGSPAHKCGESADPVEQPLMNGFDSQLGDISHGSSPMKLVGTRRELRRKNCPLAEDCMREVGPADPQLHWGGPDPLAMVGQWAP